ncbi:MAG: HAMP domain-containing sensor histidine kinase [Acidimicrobiales bacterium]
MSGTRLLTGPTRARHGTGLVRRLVAGSLAVALVSIALLAVVILLVADADLGSAGHEQEKSATNVLVTTLRLTYLSAGGWRRADLAAVGELARTIGFGLEVETGGHRLLDVATSQPEGPSRILPIIVGGREVGTATVKYPASGLSLAEVKLRRSIGAAVGVASMLAMLLAFAAAVIAARRLVAPVRLLTDAARRLGTGDLTSRVGDIVAPVEIGELARSFDAMASRIERQDTLRRTMVADLAHELRTPLAVLRAEVEALAVGVEEMSPAALTSLGDEVSRLSRLVEDLEVLAAAEAAGLSLRLEPMDLADTARSAVERLEARFEEREIEFTTDLISTNIVADPGRVEQIVLNLLSNAAKFTASGGMAHLVVDHDATTARLVVSDTGAGIPPAEQAAVFERFFRGAGARGTPGSGIGLAVVSELAIAHGGSIELESAPNVGTTVTLFLPLA